MYSSQSASGGGVGNGVGIGVGVGVGEELSGVGFGAGDGVCNEIWKMIFSQFFFKKNLIAFKTKNQNSQVLVLVHLLPPIQNKRNKF